MLEKKHTYCRICEPNCGLVATLEGGASRRSPATGNTLFRRAMPANAVWPRSTSTMILTVSVIRCVGEAIASNA